MSGYNLKLSAIPYHQSSEIRPQHLYITSDEKIKEGDWVYHCASNKLFKYDGRGLCVEVEKIILTTDQDLIKDGVQAIDDEFLEWFVKNPSCEEVKTDLVPVNEFGSKITVGGYGFDKFKYNIIIPKEEPKQTVQEYEYIGECRGNDGNGCFMDSPAHNCGCFVRKPKQETTLEEIAKKVYPDNIVQLSPTFFHNTADIRRHDFIQGYNLHKGELYSEEEVLNLLINFNKHTLQLQSLKLGNSFNVNDWFEQFKKK
jgi:hypothetical protein